MPDKWPSGTIQDANWQTSAGNVPGDSDARGEMLANLALVQKMLDAVDGNAEVLTDVNSANIAFTDVINAFIAGQIFPSFEVRSTTTTNGEIRMRTTGGSLVQSSDIIKSREPGIPPGLYIDNRGASGQVVNSIQLLDDGSVVIATFGTSPAEIRITVGGDINLTTTGIASYKSSEIATLADI